MSEHESEWSNEIRSLASRYGEPLRRTARLFDDAYWDHATVSRTAEVCMVVRRPGGDILTFAKTFYPPGVYRLLTGGIEDGESVFNALMRETHEETGLEVAVRRFLAHVTYGAAESDVSGDPVRFETFAFLLEEIGGTLGAIDSEEQVREFRDVDVAELPRLAGVLERLEDGVSDDLDENWSQWGIFRAVVTRAVHDALLTLPLAE